MFKLQASLSYKDNLDKLVKTNEILKKRLMSALQKLSLNPTHPSLRSHKVNTSKHGVQWSSRVTGDIRIIWDYDSSERLVILLLDIGGHSGSRKVYK